MIGIKIRCQQSENWSVQESKSMKSPASTCDLLLLQVSLGVLLKNENKADDMIEITPQRHQYVSAGEEAKAVYVQSTRELVQVKDAVFNKIFLR